MSLINDALKRARQTDQRNSPPPTAAPALRPVEVARRTTSGPGWLLPVAVVAFVLLGGGLLMWFALGNRGTRPLVVPAKENATALAPSPASVKLNTGAIVRENTAPVASEATQTPIATLPIAKPAPAPAAGKPLPPPEVLPAVVTSPDTPQTSTPAPSVTATNATGVTAEPLPPALPKLQGIFYRPNRPSALLNGKTYVVGGRSGEFLVVAITQQSVTVVRAGQTNVLNLPD